MIGPDDRNHSQYGGHSSGLHRRIDSEYTAFGQYRIILESHFGSFHSVLWPALDVDKFEWLAGAYAEASAVRDSRIVPRAIDRMDDGPAEDFKSTWTKGARTHQCRQRGIPERCERRIQGLCIPFLRCAFGIYRGSGRWCFGVFLSTGSERSDGRICGDRYGTFFWLECGYRSPAGACPAGDNYAGMYSMGAPGSRTKATHRGGQCYGWTDDILSCPGYPPIKESLVSRLFAESGVCAVNCLADEVRNQKTPCRQVLLERPLLVGSF